MKFCLQNDSFLKFPCFEEPRVKDVRMVTFIRHLWDICSQGENTTICNIIERSSAWCSYPTHFYKVGALEKGFSQTKIFAIFLKNWIENTLRKKFSCCLFWCMYKNMEFFDALWETSGRAKCKSKTKISTPFKNKNNKQN